MASTRAPFLSTKYGGYYHSQVPKEDDELTHVGPGTPAGEYLRRFWQPVCYADELGDTPVGLKILGEELVAFRDFSGRVGLVEAHCPHRGTSLEYGLVSERGIRCCYHGWLFDVDGTILETPGEPAGSTFKDRLCHGAYPVHEHCGTIFAYMGPPEEMPPFPIPDSFDREGYRLMPGQRYDYPCNYLQILENAMDPVHTSFLHTIVSGSQFTDEFGVVPNLDFMETPAGIIYIATRRVGDNIWVRSVENVLPNLQQVAPIWEDGRDVHGFDGPMMTRWIVPRDDQSTMLLELRHISECRGEGTGLVAGPQPDASGPASHIRRPPRAAAPARRLRGPGDPAAHRGSRPGASRRHRPGHHHVPAADSPGHPGGAERRGD